MRVQDLIAYEMLENHEITDLNSKGTLLRHKKSGARVMLLENDDENKVFWIGFRTPPYDNTGVPHIMEHSVLCGSKEFPMKDPFVELAKGSLNTFLNAMTYPDRTIYPVASCNDKDFQNLMHVYMDAVFYPNIYQRKEIFKQEGWHYELESPEGDITYNGVVYNEMKGAYSSADDLLFRSIYSSLYPDTAYALESGGLPMSIPDLTYEEFLEFHSKFYHPSNSYIYLYGDMDMAEKLQFLDEAYLNQFEKKQVDSELKLQKPFSAPCELVKYYSITEQESLKDNTHMAYSMVVDTCLNCELNLAFQILNYCLLGVEGAPLKQAMIDRGICKDVDGVYENEIYQPFLSVIAKKSNKEKKQEFIDTINEVLRDAVKKGLDKKSLEAGINIFEFKYREADYGSYPKGLMYGLKAFASWLHDESDPFRHIDAGSTLAFLREQVDTRYFEELIEKYLLNNPHASLVITEPKRGLTTEMDAEVAKKLAEYKESLSEDELLQLVADTKALKDYQGTASTQEELSKLPMLQIEDIDKEAAPFINDVQVLNGMTYTYHDLFTSGIGYVKLLFDMKNVPQDLVSYAGLLKTVLGMVNTKNFSYGDLRNEINRSTGGISTTITIYEDLKDRTKFRSMFEISTKALYSRLDFAFDMIKEIVFESVFTDKKRLRDIISIIRSRLEEALECSANTTAVERAMTYYSECMYYNDLLEGIEFYRMIENLERNFDAEADALIEKLTALMGLIFRKDNLLIDFTGNKEAFEVIKKNGETLSARLSAEKTAAEVFEFPIKQKNEGFKTASQVQYVAVAGDFCMAGLPYTGALQVMRKLLSYDYLWTNVRIKGGAYGCMCSFTMSGHSFLVSYRDPNLEKTLETFRKTFEYLKNIQIEDRDMLKFIIGTISNLDIPRSSKAKGARSLSAYLSNCDFERVQKERDEILATNQETIRELAKYVKAVVDQNNLCVIGGEEKIKAQSALFGSVENLFL